MNNNGNGNNERTIKPVIFNVSGYKILVDSQDAYLFDLYHWHIAKRRNKTYAARGVRRGGRRLIYLHREIMNPPRGMEVDHIDHDGLNNSRTNLRICTQSQNQMTSRRISAKSGFRGVYKHSKGGRDYHKWFATIQIDGHRVHLGTFLSPVEAAMAYDNAARKHFGEFASPNFIARGRK